MILPPKPFGSSGRNLGYSLRLDRTHRDSWLSVDSCCDQAKSYVIPNDVAEGRSGRRTQELRQNGVCGQSLLSLQRRFRRDHDGRSRGSWNPGTRFCRRRRDPCSAWLPSVCRPKTPYASGLRDKRGNLCAGSRRRSLPADRKSSQQTTPCVLAVRRPCPSIVPWWRRRIARWPFPVGCTSPQDHGRDFRSTLLSAWGYCSFV